MTRKLHMAAAFISLITWLAPAAAHATILYDISRTVGDYEISGHIETDGTTGVIDRAAVLDWHLDIYGFFGPTMETMTPADSSLVFFGAGFQATATQLLFDFSQVDSIGFAGNTGTLWCLGGTDAICISPSTEVVQTSLGRDSLPRSGLQVIGVASVPAPAAAWLFGPGLVWLAGMAVRKRPRAAASSGRG